MTELLIMRGLPASGKTSIAKSLTAYEPGYLRVSRDDLRESMGINGGMGTNVQEQLITKLEHGAAREALRSGVNVVVDDMNLRIKYVRDWVNLAAECNASVNVLDLTDKPLTFCLANDRLRQEKGHRFVGEDVIRDIWQRLVKGRVYPLPMPDPTVLVTIAEQYVPQMYTPHAVMVDIDGTVADCTGIRDPYDTSKYHLDTPKPHVISLVQIMAERGHSILFCSGRDEAYRGVTQLWIDKHVLDPDGYDDVHTELFMRPEGDTRRDDIVKLELFDKYIRSDYNVKGVFDDRDRVVKAWRSIGLTVFQVAEGNF